MEPQLKKIVSSVTVSPAKGWYRTAPQADCWRWEASVKVQDSVLVYTVGSYDTVTDCLRFGFTLNREKGVTWEAHANDDPDRADDECWDRDHFGARG